MIGQSDTSIFRQCRPQLTGPARVEVPTDKGEADKAEEQEPKEDNRELRHQRRVLRHRGNEPARLSLTKPICRRIDGDIASALAESNAGDGRYPRPEPAVQHLLRRPRTCVRKRRPRQPRLRHRLQRRVAMGGGEGLGQQRLEARVVVEVVGEAVALDADAGLPSRAALVRLIAPLEQVKQEDGETADQLALFRAPQALDFLGDVLDVRLSQLSRAQEVGLLAAPGEEIAVVKRALHGHGGRLQAAAGRVHGTQAAAEAPRSDAIGLSAIGSRSRRKAVLNVWTPDLSAASTKRLRLTPAKTRRPTLAPPSKDTAREKSSPAAPSPRPPPGGPFGRRTPAPAGAGVSGSDCRPDGLQSDRVGRRCSPPSLDRASPVDSAT